MAKVLILGAKGMLGQELLKVFGSEAIGWDREEVDVTQKETLKLKIKTLKPEAVINCVAYNDVDGAEDNRGSAFKLNSDVPGNLAKIAGELNIPAVHFSTNYVFNGEAGEYTEAGMPGPLSVYAESKYSGEQKFQKNTEKFYLVRTSVLFGPKGKSTASKRSFVDLMLDLSEKSDTIKAVSDEVNSLTLASDLAIAVKNLLDKNLPYGIYHITNSGSASWYEAAKEIFAITNRKINLIPVSSSEFPRKARRPAKAVLLNTKLPALRSWQEALREFLSRVS